MKKVKRKKYKGLGFVELLISLAVAAIAVTVLMNMTTSSMREAIRYERQDALTRLAMDGALIVRRHAEWANDPEQQDNIVFSPLPPNCYKLEMEVEGSEGMVDFGVKIAMGSNIHDDLKAKNVSSSRFHTDIVYNKDLDLGDVYYLAYCVEEQGEINKAPGDSVGKLYSGQILTGFVDCRGCGIEPYEQSIVVTVRD